LRAHLYFTLKIIIKNFPRTYRLLPTMFLHVTGSPGVMLTWSVSQDTSLFTFRSKNFPDLAVKLAGTRDRARAARLGSLHSALRDNPCAIRHSRFTWQQTGQQ
jgi:hypothetical protein